MNGYQLTARMRKVRAQYQLSWYAQLLYHELVAVCNKSYWKEVFQCSNANLYGNLNITEKTLLKARKELISAGLVFYQPGKQNHQPSSYSFIEPFGNGNMCTPVAEETIDRDTDVTTVPDSDLSTTKPASEIADTAITTVPNTEKTTVQNAVDANPAVTTGSGTGQTTVSGPEYYIKHFFIIKTPSSPPGDMSVSEVDKYIFKFLLLPGRKSGLWAVKICTFPWKIPVFFRKKSVLFRRNILPECFFSIRFFIKENTGLTLNEYLYYLRLEHVRQLPEAPGNQNTIGIIAEKSGLKSKTFKVFRQWDNVFRLPDTSKLR